MAAIDIELQELVAVVETVAAEYDVSNPDTMDGLDGRSILLTRLSDLGWISPTEAEARLRNSMAGRS